MRTTSAAQAKGKETSPRQNAPRPGTAIRVAYDLLQANHGLPVTIRDPYGVIKAQLQDIYGLDIRNCGQHRYLLAGEWFGRVYIDYVAERL